MSFFFSLRHMTATSMITAIRYTYSRIIIGTDSCGAMVVTRIEPSSMTNATGMKNSPRLRRAST